MDSLAENLTQLLDLDRKDSVPKLPEEESNQMKYLKEEISIRSIGERNKWFTGREDILDEMGKKLKEKSTAVCLSGTSGMGKTAIALEFCYRNEKNFTFIAWLKADSSTRLLLSLWTLGQALGTQQPKKMAPKVSGSLQTYLLKNPGWLIVLDDMSNEAFEMLGDRLYKCGGSLILTTRFPISPVNWVYRIQVPELSESAQLFGKVIGSKRPTDFEELKEELATKKLGQHPIAVIHAGSYIRETNCTIHTYFERFQHSADILKKKLRGVQYNRPVQVLTTFHLSMDHLRKETEDTFHLLSICSVLETKIQDALLHAAPKLKEETEMETKKRVEEGKLLLIRFSMLDWLPKAVKIHPLVQESFLLNTLGVEKLSCFSNSERALEDSINREGNINLQMRLCVVHCEAVLRKFHQQFAEQSGASAELEQTYERASQLLHGACSLLGIPMSQNFLEQQIKTVQTVFGASSSVVANVFRNVAREMENQREFDKEKELLESLLRNQQESQNSLEVAKTLVSLAGCHLFLGDVQRMEETHEKALKIFESSFTEEVRNQIAAMVEDIRACYGILGKFQREKEILERMLKIYISFYGKNHAQVARVMASIGDWYRKVGNFERLKDILERTLVMLRSIEGDHRLQIAKTLSNLGVCHINLEDYHKAIKMLEEALETHLPLIDVASSDVGTTMMNLGTCYGIVGDYAKQKEMLKKALKIFESSGGDHRLEIAKTLGNLGNSCAFTRDYQGQRVNLEKALEIKQSLFGNNHFEVALTLFNLGVCFGQLGDHIREKVMLERALEIFLSSGEHYQIEVAQTLLNLGRCCHSLRNFQESIRLLKKGIEILEESAQAEKLCGAYRSLAASLASNFTETSAIRNLIEAKQCLEKECALLMRNSANPVFRGRLEPNLAAQIQLEVQISNAQRRSRCTVL